MPTRGARLWVNIKIPPLKLILNSSAVHAQKIIFFLFCKDREAIQKLEGRVRSERTTCGETVSLAVIDAVSKNLLFL